MLDALLKAIEALVNTILKAVFEFLQFLGINVNIDPIDITDD